MPDGLRVSSFYAPKLLKVFIFSAILTSKSANDNILSS
ncbi:hypothetical protein HMPREF1249_0996 [Jonquetella sp. BV3C21]|nr:hypothetical protein HMPREF1249_0996 [Jonquetella sp. BV3C21]